jgi:putative zinc finger/helix-turn-helix YgiT family protein
MESEVVKGGPVVTCTECGGAMKVREEPYRYRECGLPCVTLAKVEVSRCGTCGNFEVSIPRIEQLHRLIAKHLIEKLSRFTGVEIRFLRKSLGLSGTDFARRMGVAAETVSRWENDATPIGAQADRLLRLLVAQGTLMSQYPEERLARIDDGKATDFRLGVEHKGRAWTVIAA